MQKFHAIQQKCQRIKNVEIIFYQAMQTFRQLLSEMEQTDPDEVTEAQVRDLQDACKHAMEQFDLLQTEKEILSFLIHCE